MTVSEPLSATHPIPGLRAAVSYQRPFDRGPLLSALASLGMFVVEQPGDDHTPVWLPAVDLTILVARGHADLPTIRTLARETPTLLVIVPSPEDVSECLDAGASFCLPDRELLEFPRSSLLVSARIARQRRSHLRADNEPWPSVSIRGVTFSWDSCSLVRGETRVGLSRTERDVLLCLAAEPGTPVRSEVLASAARIGDFPASRYLGSVILRIRRKLRRLGVDGDVLATVYGVGYVLLPGSPESPGDAP